MMSRELFGGRRRGREDGKERRNPRKERVSKDRKEKCRLDGEDKRVISGGKV